MAQFRSMVPKTTLLAGLAALVGVVAFSPPANAVTQTASTSSITRVAGSSSDTGLLKGTIITLASGKTARLPKNWSEMTRADLAAIGIAPNQTSAAAKAAGFTSNTGVTAPPSQRSFGGTPKTSGLIRPNSASGCNSYVCIYVAGSGLRIDSWQTKRVATGGMFTFSVWWDSYTHVFLTGSGTYVPASGTVWSNLLAIAMPHTFPAPTQLCNTWENISGKPCINLKR